MRRGWRNLGRVVVALAAVVALGGDRPPAAVPAALPAGRLAREERAVLRVVSLGCGGFALGSGVAVPGGLVLTNRHVVAGADYVEVRRGDGVRIGARVERVGRDVDLAVLWAGEAVGPGVEPGGRLRPRQAVSLFGHPAGGPLVRSEGRVTARYRFDLAGMRSEGAWVEAAVAPGSSGGPAFGAGDLVGVVFARERATGLAGVIDGETAAAFLAGTTPSVPGAGPCERGGGPA